MLHFGAMALVLALSPSTYDAQHRRAMAMQVHVSTWQVLPGFTALFALVSLVLIRIVVVTAQSYGLSQYALEMVVRVLVMELIPLSAALFVVLRSGMTASVQVAAMRDAGGFDELRTRGLEPMRHELVPRISAIIMAVLTLAAVSCAVALILAYLVVHGFSPWGLAGYTRIVGRVFEPAVALAFAVKVLLFALAVGVVPVAAAMHARGERSSQGLPHGTVRLFLALVLIEAGSLALRYV